jgi:hypothetical protein
MPMTQAQADALAEVISITKMSAQELEDFGKQPREAQLVILDTYKAQDWTDPATPIGQRLLQIAGVVATIASDVSAVAGGIAALVALL